ncbi:MAG: archaetidylserine decarboxylase [Rhodoferax sp.]
MSIRKDLQTLLHREDLNFLLTNRIPRRILTRFMGWFSKLEQPLIRDASIAVWKFFSDLDLSEAKLDRFKSMHDCFTRELKQGVRPIDNSECVLVSPVDAIIGANGRICDARVFQAKGFPYALTDLLGTDEDLQDWHDGFFVTLRLTSSMYHRFHAPCDCTVERVRYFSGDTWNVNPIALKRIEKLFCKNERAFISAKMRSEGPLANKRIALVPVAAILVASIRLHFLDVLFHLKYSGPQTMDCSAQFFKGQEMGWFEHGSTVIVLAPKEFTLDAGLKQGMHIRMGQALLRGVTSA